MSLRVTFRRAAEAEFVLAAARYEALRQNLGVEFIAEMGRCVALAAEQPHLFAVIQEGVRRVIASRFPYSVYFRIEERFIVVLAVFHGSRGPAIWQRRS